MTLLARAAILAIRRYQRAGGGKGLLLVDCDFEPSCSEYARQAIERFGLLRGLRLALSRLGRCDGRNGHHRVADPVPKG
jgi:putative component of membrane protein insertase Oxa1/YidC/SpoIIIJ protein YidD